MQKLNNCNSKSLEMFDTNVFYYTQDYTVGSTLTHSINSQVELSKTVNEFTKQPQQQQCSLFNVINNR